MEIQTMPPIENNGSIKVSVVVPTYNHEKYIGQCLDSIINQKVDFSYEILVGEDKSTDNTREIVMKYEKEYPGLVKAFYRDGKDKIIIDGVMTGRKNLVQLLQASKGEYIAYCDGDDFWNTEHKLQKQVDFLDNNPDYVMCFSDICLVNGNGEKISNHHPALRRIERKEYFETADIIANIMVATVTVLFRNKLDFYNLPEFYYSSLAGDMVLFVLISQLGKAKCMYEQLSSYRINDKGLWTSLDAVSSAKYLSTTLQNINKYFNYKYEDAVNKGISLCTKNSDTATKILEMADFDDKIKLHFSSTKNLYIYGAGILGKIILKHMRNTGINVDGFIESGRQEPKTKVQDLLIYDLDSIKHLENATIIVTAINDSDSIIADIYAANNMFTAYPLDELLELFNKGERND